jgi:hypothetical protein
MCHHIKKNKVIILLEMNDKCRSNQSPTSQEGKGNQLTIEGKPIPFKEAGKVTQ